MASHQIADEGRRLLGIPMSCRDLRHREAHETVAAFQRVIEKREFMVTRKRRQPQRQPGEIDSAGVLIDTIETALSNETTGMEFLVLVGRDRWPRIGPTLPSLDEPFADHAAGLNQKGARAHRRVADFEVEHLIRHRILAETLERR